MNGSSSPGFPRDQIRALDQSAIEAGIPGILLMEHAAIGASMVALDALEGRSDLERRPHAWVCCGPGNNGGDGYAMARHLACAGVHVTVWELTPPLEGNSDPAVQRRALAATDAQLVAVDSDERLAATSPPPADLVIDAIFGTGITRAPAGRFAAAIDAVTAHAAPVLAVDTPSGLDADLGTPLGTTVRARWTVTFALPKKGFFSDEARGFTGELLCVPIGIPGAMLPAGTPAFPPSPYRVAADGSWVVHELDRLAASRRSQPHRTD